jgi:hypothetical protein
MPILSALGTKPHAIIPAEGLHGFGQKKLFLHDRLQINGVFIVAPVFQILRVQLDLLGPLDFGASRTKGMPKRDVHGQRIQLKASTAFNAKHGPEPSSYEDVLPASFKKHLPMGVALNLEPLQYLPAGIPLSEEETEPLLWDAGARDLHNPLP